MAKQDTRTRKGRWIDRQWAWDNPEDSVLPKFLVPGSNPNFVLGDYGRDWYSYSAIR